MNPPVTPTKFGDPPLKAVVTIHFWFSTILDWTGHLNIWQKRKYLGWKLKWKFVVISGLAIVITSQPHHIRSGQEYVNVRITSLDYILQKVFEDQHGFISNAKSKRWTFIMWRPSFPCDFFTRLNTTFGLICGLRSGFLWTLFPQMQDSNR